MLNRLIKKKKARKIYKFEYKYKIKTTETKESKLKEQTLYKNKEIGAILSISPIENNGPCISLLYCGHYVMY